MPFELASRRKELIAKRHRPHVPLPRGDDLERSLTAFVELDGVGDLPRLADTSSVLPEQFDEPSLCLADGLADELAIGLVRCISGSGRKCCVAEAHGLESSVAPD